MKTSTVLDWSLIEQAAKAAIAKRDESALGEFVRHLDWLKQFVWVNEGVKVYETRLRGLLARVECEHLQLKFPGKDLRCSGVKKI